MPGACSTSRVTVAKPVYNIAPGLTLGRNYYVIDFLGSGWEGEVYKVRERRSGILRAAKVFYNRKHISDESLRRYANKMDKLRACHIVTQYHHRDVARVGRKSVEIMVSDLADGEMLSAYIARQRGKRISTFEALHLLYDLASGVEQIHQRNEYHGDIHSNNIMVKRRGLSYEVHLLDFFDLGRSTKEKIQYDVYDMIGIFYEVIGGARGYAKVRPAIRKIICGRKRTLIRKQFKTAGQLRVALENLEWDD